MKQIQNILNNTYAFLKQSLVWFNKLYESKWLIWCIIAVGIFFRIARWSQNFSLWLDEAMITLNIVNRNFIELTQPLDHFQEAPVGFLFIEKFFTVLFGESELVLRLFPLLASVGALLLFYKVAKSCLSKKAVSAAMIFFAISPELIHYSAIVKPYSSDVLACVVILLVATVLFKDKVSKNEIILSLSAVFFIPYVSYTSIFVICGLIAGLFINFIVKRRKEDFLTLLYIGITFLISIAVFYLLIIRYKDDPTLDAYWSSFFLPFPPKNSSELVYIIKEICFIFRNPLHITTNIFNIGISSILGIMTLLGVIVAFCKKRYVYASIFVITLLAILTASGLKQYPFSPRLILCLIPLFVLFLSEGLAFICSKSYMTPIFIVILVLLTRLQWHEGLYKTTHKRAREDIRPMIKHIVANKKDGDKIYVYFRTKFAFWYYAKRFDIPKEDYYIGINYTISDDTYMTDVKNLKGADAVWVLMSHYKNKPAYLHPLLGAFKKYGVRQNQHFHQSNDAKLYMYEIPDKGLYKTTPQSSHEDILPMVKYIIENKKDGDKIYVYFRTKFAFKYYAKRFDIPEEDYYIGINYTISDDTYMTDVKNLKGADAVWVLMSHYKNKPAYLRPLFDTLEKYGERQNQHYHESRDAKLYMYEINK